MIAGGNMGGNMGGNLLLQHTSVFRIYGRISDKLGKTIC